MRPVCGFHGWPRSGTDSHVHSAGAAGRRQVSERGGTESRIERDEWPGSGWNGAGLPGVPSESGREPVHDGYTRARAEGGRGGIREGCGPDAATMCAVGTP